MIRLEVEQLEGRLVPSMAAPPLPPAPYALWGTGIWSGIGLDTTTGAVTAVRGSWVVPAVTGSGYGSSAAWVGIDGNISGTVEQIGTDSDTVSTAAWDGTSQYFAWYEMFPAWGHLIPLPVQAGDQMSASVVYSGQTISSGAINDNFALTITDYRNSIQQWTFSTIQSVPGGQVAERNSAEWIQEAPDSSSQLANFGSITFTGADATISGSSGTIASFVGQPSVMKHGTQAAPREINLYDMGTFNRYGQWTSVADETSMLSSSGDSFTIQYGASNPSPPASPPEGAEIVRGPARSLDVGLQAIDEWLMSGNGILNEANR